MFGIFKVLKLKLKPVSDAFISDSVADAIELGWTKQHDATDANGNPVIYLSRDASNLCALAAINRTFMQNCIDTERRFYWLLAFYDFLKSSPRFTDVLPTDRVMCRLRIVEWNDSDKQTQENVAATFRDFAAHLRSQPDNA